MTILLRSRAAGDRTLGKKEYVSMKNNKYMPPEERLLEWKFPVDEKKKAEGMAAICREITEKKIRHYPVFLENVWIQVKFQPMTHWIVEGGLLLSAMALMLWLTKIGIREYEMLMICSVFIVFAGNIALSSIGRLFSWHMAELEQTLYLNLKQMVCIRMLEAGVFDLAVMGLFMGAAGRSDQIEAGMYLIYMLVPFLWSDTLYLHMIGCFRNTAYGLKSFAAGIVCGMLACFPLIWEEAYAFSYRQIWFFMAAAGTVLFIWEIRRILGKIEGGDSVCLN